MVGWADSSLRRGGFLVLGSKTPGDIPPPPIPARSTRAPTTAKRCHRPCHLAVPARRAQRPPTAHSVCLCSAIDLRLKADPLQSVCHGDAKGANILYAKGDDGETVALVYDFQYCGKAAASKDIAYFLNVDAGHAAEERLLKHYHQELSSRLTAQGDTPPTFATLQTSVELALCDWRRFSEVGLGGWGDGGANRRVQALLTKLDGGKMLASEQDYIEAMEREFPV